MKSIRPEDRPKAIALILGVIVVFGLIYVRLSAALGGAPQPAPGADAVVNLGTPSSSAPAGTPAAAPAGSPNSVNIGPPGGVAKVEKIQPPIVSPSQTKVSPFDQAQPTGNHDPTQAPDTSSGNQTGAGTRVAKTGSSGNRGGSGVAPIGDADLNALSGPIGGKAGDGTKPALPNVGVMQSDEPPLSLTGVITGGRPVAIIKVGAKDYVVSKGDLFGKDSVGRNYKLEEVTSSKVVVVKAKVRHTLTMDLPTL